MARKVPPGGPRKKPKRKIPRIRADTYEEVLDRFFDGDVARSLDRFAAMIRDDPGNPDGHAGLGFAFSWASDSIGALRHLRKARHLGDERPYTLLSMGNAYKLIDMHDEAAECFGAALAARPDFAPAHANMAYLHAKRGAHQDAVESADRACEHDDSSEAVTVKGIALLRMGMRREADAVLAEAERDHPGSFHAGLGAAYALLDGGDARGFLGRVEDARCPEPDDLGGHFKKGLKLAKRGDHAGAYEAYAAAARLEPAASVHAAMASSLVRMHGGDPGERPRAEALDLMLDAVGKDPAYTYMYFGRIHLTKNLAGDGRDPL